ncbi:MAG: acyl-ACP desaturase [Flavobacteriaceae bacterium]|nr:acyl-ACP desaturase [Flavobacteriaceae bacterium]
MGLEGLDQYNHSGWTKWVRAWNAEENRHGDVLLVWCIYQAG